MDESYLELYQAGFLPGPKESKEAFFYRVALLRKIAACPAKYITEKSFRGSIFTPVDRAYLLIDHCKHRFFQASSTTILEVETGVFIPVIKTPSKFSSLFVDSKEVMAHEQIHAQRAQFDEPKFEEIIAYRSSKSRFRQMISPVISTTKQQGLFFLLVLFMPVSLYPFLAFILWCSITSFTRQNHIHRCLANLKQISSFPEELLMAMTDKEILQMSKNDALPSNPDEFRWQFITKLFIQL
jgi:hypothetical protein